jgi:hypothetical protein
MHKKIMISVIVLTACWMCISCDTAGVKRLDDGRSKYSGGKKLSGKSAIDGHVIDAGTKKGIARAKVEIKNTNMGVGYYVRDTDWSGYFKIDDFIPYVKYMVEVTAQGYVTYTSVGTITEGSQKIELKQESVLTGVVKNRRGEPIRGVEVKLHAYNEPNGEDGEYAIRKPLITATDAGGSYRFDKLPAGSYTAAFSSPGFITETAQLQNIKQGETFTLPMVMMRPASVAGKVIIEGINTPAINVDASGRQLPD